MKHEYILEGSKILKETWGNNTLVPIYDAENSVVGIKYNYVPYLLQRNLQNDIVGIVDSTGTAVVKYSYDAWGVCTVTLDTSECNISYINPYRYRSYYYDTETGLYYLQSRYYNPIIARFLNADEIAFIGKSSEILGFNLFAYCDNDPVNNCDITGHYLTGMVAGFATVGATNSWNPLGWVIGATFFVTGIIAVGEIVVEDIDNYKFKKRHLEKEESKRKTKTLPDVKKRSKSLKQSSTDTHI